MNIWILTDGKMGDLVQCRGVARYLATRLNATITEKIIKVKSPWQWFMPWGPIPPKHHPNKKNSPISRPFPDIAIASGRRTVGYLKTIKNISPKTFTVFLKNPRTSTSCADFIWSPAHDKLRGKNVMVTDTAPHNIHESDLEHAKKNHPTTWNDLPKPWIALIIGNPEHDDFIKELEKEQKGSLIIIPSRRTPEKLMQSLKSRLHMPHWIWDEKGDNPYLCALACSDITCVTGDSHNMVGEALSTIKPVFVIKPRESKAKFKKFLDKMYAINAIKYLGHDPLKPYETNPIDVTPGIAEKIIERLGI